MLPVLLVLPVAPRPFCLRAAVRDAGCVPMRAAHVRRRVEDVDATKGDNVLAGIQLARLADAQVVIHDVVLGATQNLQQRTQTERGGVSEGVKE